MSLLNGTTLSLSVIPDLFNNDISLSSNTSADGFSNVEWDCLPNLTLHAKPKLCSTKNCSEPSALNLWDPGCPENDFMQKWRLSSCPQAKSARSYSTLLAHSPANYGHTTWFKHCLYVLANLSVRFSTWAARRLSQVLGVKRLGKEVKSYMFNVQMSRISHRKK